MRARNLFLSVLLGLSIVLWLLPSLASAAQNARTLAAAKDIAAQSQVTLSVTLEAGADNTLYEDVNGGLSNGSGEYFFVGRTGPMASGVVRRGLIRFDVAGAVPAGSTIVSAALFLSMSQTTAGPQPVELHRVTADWGEGSSDADFPEGAGITATLGDATWIHTFYSSTLWTSPGGDFVVTASATTTVDGNGAYSWSADDMVSDLQSWLDAPVTNYGWLLLGNEASLATAKRFNTRENTSPETRPVLLIEYALPYAIYLPTVLR